MSKTAQLGPAVCRNFHGSNSFSTTETERFHFENVNGVLVGTDVPTKRDSSAEITGFLTAIPPLRIVTV
jgi:hypothetical protein